MQLFLYVVPSLGAAFAVCLAFVCVGVYWPAFLEQAKHKPMGASSKPLVGMVLLFACMFVLNKVPFPAGARLANVVLSALLESKNPTREVRIP